MRVKIGHFTHQLAGNFIKNANIAWFNTHIVRTTVWLSLMRIF